MKHALLKWLLQVYLPSWLEEAGFDKAAEMIRRGSSKRDIEIVWHMIYPVVDSTRYEDRAASVADIGGRMVMEMIDSIDGCADHPSVQFLAVEIARKCAIKISQFCKSESETAVMLNEVVLRSSRSLTELAIQMNKKGGK